MATLLNAVLIKVKFNWDSSKPIKKRELILYCSFIFESLVPQAFQSVAWRLVTAIATFPPNDTNDSLLTDFT